MWVESRVELKDLRALQPLGELLSKNRGKKLEEIMDLEVDSAMELL